ncbi:MAG: uroporphyrinogen decarboxylase family protein [Candidatus Methanosuratincola sp.]
MGIIEETIRLENTGRIPVAPVITSKREKFVEVVKSNESVLKKFDGFLLHPAVFDSGWVYTPSKPSLREPMQIIKDIDGYEELSDFGPVEYAMKIHKENDLMVDLEKRLAETPNLVSGFVEETEDWGVANYCGAMGITPIGYISYYRGFNETMRDMAKDQQKIYSTAMIIAKMYPKFLAEFAKSCKVPRVWISFTNATPAIVGDYYFDKIVWPTTKIMLEGMMKEGVVPIIQFEENVKNMKFLTQLPPRSYAVHISRDSDLLRVSEMLSNQATIMGNFKVPADQEEENRIRDLAGRLASGVPKNLIVSTDGGEPFILTSHNVEKLSTLDPFLKKC